ncbi:polyprotein [Phytophthora megakarya]|uniref:Polyprotein n=1 Tax=Phytophthora megakarya TaxID=4795 RepID=A0A225VVK5_9STRA|nr:polyprotein [Phytophthora megakarya]
MAGNIVPQGVGKTRGATIEASPGVGNQVPRTHCTQGFVGYQPEVRKGLQLGTKALRSPPVEECYHVFDGETGKRVKTGAVQLQVLPEVSELLNLEEVAMEDFLAELTARDMSEMVLLRPETSPEALNSSSVMDEDVLEEFRKQRMSHLGSEILKKTKDPWYPLVKEYSDVCDVIDAFFAVKAKAGMVREWKSPHSTPTFCDRKPNGKWRLVHAYNKLNSATVPAQTPIPRKDVLLNNMSGCTLYSALDLVDGYYQILMRESDIPLTAESTPSGMLWEWLTYFEGRKTAIKVHVEHPRRVFSSVVVRADPEKVKAIAAWPTPRSQKDLREWFGLANYLHKYCAGYAGLARPLSDLLKKELKAVERNYPVHDKELLAMKYALVKFRVNLLATRPFVVFTDLASLRTAINTPHMSQRMTRWLSFFAEYNFRVEYKPGKLNVLADALSGRPDHELASISRATTDLYDWIRMAYRDEESLAPLVRFLTARMDAEIEWLMPRQRATLHRYEWAEGLLHYRVEPSDPPHVVVPNDEDPKYDILLEAHDVSSSGHLGREKTFYAERSWWPHMYKWVARPRFGSVTEPAGFSGLLEVDDPRLVFGFPADRHSNTGILVFVCHLSKIVHFATVRDTVTREQTAVLFLDGLFPLLGTRLDMSTADHPQADGQTERVNRVLEDTLHSVCGEAPQSWSDRLPMVEFALNNAVHTSTGFILFYLNGLRHPLVPLTLHGTAYIIDLPKSMTTHPTFYVGRLKRYHDQLRAAAGRDGQEKRAPRTEARP